MRRLFTFALLIAPIAVVSARRRSLYRRPRPAAAAWPWSLAGFINSSAERPTARTSPTAGPSTTDRWTPTTSCPASCRAMSISDGRAVMIPPTSRSCSATWLAGRRPSGKWITGVTVCKASRPVWTAAPTSSPRCCGGILSTRRLSRPIPTTAGPTTPIAADGEMGRALSARPALEGARRRLYNKGRTETPVFPERRRHAWATPPAARAPRPRPPAGSWPPKPSPSRCEKT